MAGIVCVWLFLTNIPLFSFVPAQKFNWSCLQKLVQNVFWGKVHLKMCQLYYDHHCFFHFAGLHSLFFKNLLIFFNFHKLAVNLKTHKTAQLYLHLEGVAKTVALVSMFHFFISWCIIEEEWLGESSKPKMENPDLFIPFCNGKSLIAI